MALQKMLQNKRKVLITWIASYSLVLMIPILIGIFVYIRSVDVISDEVNKAHNLSLQQMKSVLDGHFEEISRLDSVLSMNQNMQKLTYASKPLSVKNIMAIIDAQKDLGKFMISNSFIDKIYIYVNNGGLLFTDTYNYAGDELDGICANTLGISKDELVELARTVQIKNCIISTTSTGKKNLLFVQSLFLNDFKAPYGVSVALIDGPKLSGLLRNLEWTTQARVLLVDENDGFIDTSSKESLPDFTLYNQVVNRDATFYTKTGSGDLAVTHVGSDAVNMEYISLIPTSIFLQKVQQVKNLIYLSVALCLLLGFAAAYLVAIRNYSPVKKLTQMFVGRLGKADENFNNEFQFMEKSLKGLLDENNSFLTSLRQQKEALKNNVLVKLLKGRIHGIDKINEALDSYGIHFTGNGFVIILFSLEQRENNTLPNDAPAGESAVDLIHFIIRNIVEELASEKYSGYVAEIDGMAAGIVNINASDTENQAEQLETDMQRIAQNTIDFVENKFGVFLTASIGGIRVGADRIARAYSDALEALEYKQLVEDPGRIVRYTAIHTGSGCRIDSHFNLEKERQFINCIKAEDFKSAGAVLEDIIANDFESLPLNLVKCRMFGLINSLLNAMGEIRFALDIDFLDKLDPVNRLLNAKSIAGLKKQIDEIFNRVMEYYAEKEKRDVPSWINGVEDYVSANFSRPELSIAEISEKFNISISYLSRSFKKHKGVNLLDYIHKVRLENAKQLMKTGMNIKEIAEKSGYLEDKALIRSFKRYEGVTPGRFRVRE